MSGRSVLQNLNEQSKAGVREEPRGRFRTKDIEIQIYTEQREFLSCCTKSRSWR